MDFYQEFKSEILKIPNLPWETDTNDTLSESKADFENSVRSPHRHLTSIRKGTKIERGNSQLFHSKLDHSQSILMPQKSLAELGKDGGMENAKKWGTAARQYNEGDAFMKQHLDGRELVEDRGSMLNRHQDQADKEQLGEERPQKEFTVAGILGQYEKHSKANRDLVVETLFKYRRGESLHYHELCLLYQPHAHLSVAEVSGYNLSTLSSI
jgi:hypothetical protein